MVKVLCPVTAESSRTFPGGNDADDLIEAARRGRALKVEKPMVEQAPAQIIGKHDPTLSDNAAVNKKPEMSYAEAMAAMADGTLERSVLTEQGWVTLNRGSMKSGTAAA